MKKMKRLVAVLLAGIMALAVLTACDGTPVTRDEALGKNVAQWTVELGKDANLELTVDDELMAMSAKYLPTEVKRRDAIMAEDWEAFGAAQNELDDVFAVGTKVARVDMVLELNGAELTKEVLAQVVQVKMNDIQNALMKAGIEKPTKFGVTVTEQKDYTLIFFVVSE
ncbi:hypothetical protein [Faecalibacterium wellingii]|uniref:Uncharacterized protein n=1 Tax=Faecalibacterium wellingii TaxID=2929491 RepID=A0ABU3U0I2_9FIRM|nr:MULTISPECIES: hypothetical protein [Faecalibacterium]MDU8689000.1 hypothetical protein [Faecalibacterium prausnitzii]UQK56493.1 hypothetical protein MTP37_12860 [Faecalibacterium sp. HTF-F]